MTALKRLKVCEASERISWRNPRFADWELTWRSDSSLEETTWMVHRNVLIGGPRACLFFDGAAREGAYDRKSSEMSKLLPEACKCQMERMLDFIYGLPMDCLTTHDAMPLLKIADVLQCPSLHNEVIEIMQKGIDESGNVEAYLVEACQFELPTVAEALVNSIPLRQLTKIDFDMLEIDNAALMRTLARRLSLARMTQWGRFEGEGKVIDGSVAISLPENPTEQNRKQYWCRADSLGAMLVGKQTWQFRIDHLPPKPDQPSAFRMHFAAVSGPCKRKANGATAYEAGVSFILNTSASGFYNFKTVSKLASEDEWTVHNLGRGRVLEGDILSLTTRFSNLTACGDAQWDLNGIDLGWMQGRVSPAPLSVCLELHNEYNTIGATLIEHTVHCKRNCFESLNGV